MAERPEFRAEDEALEPEFALASALIEARGRAGMTQAQVARAMGTTQAVIARLEGGRVKPSTRTLERFAKATGTRLRIRFEPGTHTRVVGRLPRVTARNLSPGRGGSVASATTRCVGQQKFHSGQRKGVARHLSPFAP